MRLSLVLAACLLTAQGAAAQPAASIDAEREVRRVLGDYIGLYRADALPRWKALFVPGFVAAFTNDDGSVTTRTLDEFYDRQAKYFATGRRIREELEHVRVDLDGPLASIGADFVLHDNDTESRGKLKLLFIRDRGIFKIQSLIFSYHAEPASSR